MMRDPEWLEGLTWGPSVMRARRRVEGELERLEPQAVRLECGCCGVVRPVHEITHVCLDMRAVACEECGPELFDAELHLRATPGIRPPTMEDLNSMKEGW